MQTRTALALLLALFFVPACDTGDGDGTPAPEFHSTDALGDNEPGEGVGQCLGAPCGAGLACAEGLDCVGGWEPGAEVCAPACDPAVPCGDDGSGIDASCGVPVYVTCVGDETPHCLPAACETDADCGDGVCVGNVCRPS